MMSMNGIFLALGIRLLLPWPLSFGPIVLYLGPETIMPLASILAALVGVLLIAWRHVLGFLRRIVGKRGDEPSPDATTDGEDDR